MSAAVNCQPLAVNLNFCARTVTTANVLGSSPRRLNPWTFEFKNGVDVLQVPGPTLAGTDVAVPFPVNVTISTTGGLTPTISWTVPTGFTPNGFRVQIYDRGQILPSGQADIIQSANLAPTATS
jgi:hypothetical protein